MRNRLLLILFFSLIYFLYWKSYPTFVDEKWTMVVANGLSFDTDKVFNRMDSLSIERMQATEIYQNNTSFNVYKACISDGGNGQFYYQIAHMTVVLFAPAMGVFNSLKALSVLCSLIMVLIFYNWMCAMTGERNALLAAIFLSAVSAGFNIYVRNYAMSNMFCVLFYSQFYSYIIARNNGRTVSVFWLVLSMIVLPFVHFFNVFILAISALLVMWSVFIQKYSWLRYRAWLLSLAASASLFLFYYFALNTEGRNYQSLVSSYFRDFASHYGTQGNTWLAPAAPKYFLSENIELTFRLTGLDLRDSFRWLRMSWFAGLLILPITLVFAGLRASNKVLLRPMRISLIALLLAVLAYLTLLNLVYMLSGHAIALNSQWYSSPLFALVAAAFAICLSLNQSRYLRWIFATYLTIVCVNSMIYSFNPEMRIQNEKEGVALLSKIEEQFD